MKFKLNFVYLLIFILNFGLIPINGIGNQGGLSFEIQETSPSEFTISQAILEYEIYTGGGYQCQFLLNCLDESSFSLEKLSGVLKILGNTDPQLTMFCEETPIDEYIIDISINKTYCFFNLPRKFQQGTEFTITGSYQGLFSANTSGILTYWLGIDWGITTPKLNVSIEFLDMNQELRIPELPENPPSVIRNKNGDFLYWNKEFESQFSVELTSITRTNILNTAVIIDPPSWVGKVGTLFEIQIQNFAKIPLTIQIYKPNWIDCDITSFQIFPMQIRNITFSISSPEPSISNGTIFFYLIELDYAKTVLVKLEGVHSNLNSVISTIFVLALFVFIPSSIGIYFNWNSLKKNLYQIFESNTVLKESLPSQFSWSSISARWGPILADKEFQVIDKVFQEGPMSQQTLADHIDVSNPTMSRIISRLEVKQLVYRERTSLGNMIHLNWDHL
jgi:hypothetical protein